MLISAVRGVIAEASFVGLSIDCPHGALCRLRGDIISDSGGRGT